MSLTVILLIFLGWLHVASCAMRTVGRSPRTHRLLQPHVVHVPACNSSDLSGTAPHSKLRHAYRGEDTSNPPTDFVPCCPSAWSNWDGSRGGYLKPTDCCSHVRHPWLYNSKPALSGTAAQLRLACSALTWFAMRSRCTRQKPSFACMYTYMYTHGLGRPAAHPAVSGTQTAMSPCHFVQTVDTRKPKAANPSCRSLVRGDGLYFNRSSQLRRLGAFKPFPELLSGFEGGLGGLRRPLRPPESLRSCSSGGTKLWWHGSGLGPKNQGFAFLGFRFSRWLSCKFFVGEVVNYGQ